MKAIWLIYVLHNSRRVKFSGTCDFIFASTIKMVALHSFEKRFCHFFSFFVSMPYFVVWIFWPVLRICSQGVCFFDKFKNITHDVR